MMITTEPFKNPYLLERGLEFEMSQDGRIVFGDRRNIYFTLRRIRDGLTKRFEMPIPHITTPSTVWMRTVKEWLCDAVKEMAE